MVSSLAPFFMPLSGPVSGDAGWGGGLNGPVAGRLGANTSGSCSTDVVCTQWFFLFLTIFNTIAICCTCMSELSL